MSNSKKNGFVLIYTVIMIGIVLSILILNLGQNLSEIKFAREEVESVKAFYAADTGLGCARYWWNASQVFDTSKPSRDYECGVGKFTAGGNPTTADCVAATYDMPLQRFSNGACADVKVTTIPFTVSVGGVTATGCSIHVVSTGKNSCSASGANLVQRVRVDDY